MPSNLNEAFALDNLRRAWRWTLANPEAMYKNYFRRIYEAYAVADDKLLNHLRVKLRRGVYEPTDACKIYIPKKSGILRPFTLLAVEDQVVYQALANIIAEKLYPTVRQRYYKETFGHLYAGKRNRFFYRKWQVGYRKFGTAIREAFSRGFVYRAFFDLTACYDSIDHHVLRHFLKELQLDTEFIDFVLRNLRHWTKADTVNPIYQGHGIPQGPLPSGLLAEVVLSHFDKQRGDRRKVKYFRYVDDIRLYAKDERHLRRMIVELDLLSKSIGLFPQSSKIDIREVTDVDGEIKSISNPPEPVYRRYGFQGIVHKRLKTLTHHYRIEDETRFKYVLARVSPLIATSRRLLRIVRSYPHLYISIFRYFSRYTMLPLEIARQLYMILKDEALYPSFSAELIHAMLGRLPDRLSPILNRHIKTMFDEGDRIGRSDLKAACGAWLLQNRALNYVETKHLIVGARNWWIKAATLPYVDKDFIGMPSYTALLNQMIKSKNVDDSILAAYLIAVEELSLTTATVRINEAAALLLKDFGIVARGGAFICGIETSLNAMLKVPILDVNWRTIFGGRYSVAERKIIRAKGYFKTDPTAWVNIMDTFNDLLLDLLFAHDHTIGNYQLGNMGGVLNSTSAFALKYPAMFKAANDIHSTRLDSDLSHHRNRRTGRTTKPIKYNYLPKACRLLYDAFTELWDKW